MEYIYKIKDFNLNNLNSKLLHNMDDSDEENDTNELDINLNISLKDIEDFNNRIINPKNVNNIIKICDFFLIENVEKFLIENSIPTLEKYIIDELEINKNGIIEKIKKYKLPMFMTEGFENFYYAKTYKNNYDYDYYERKYYAIQDMASYGLINWIKLLLNNKSCNISLSQAATHAAFNNKLECVIFLNDNNIEQYHTGILNAAAYGGHLDIIKFLKQKDCKMNVSTCSFAALNNHLHCLKYLYDNNCPWDFKTLSNAAICGSIECMKFAYENGCQFIYSEGDYDFDDRENSCEEAASYGNLECLKYAFYNKCPLGLIALENAARYGNLDCLKFVWSFIEKNPRKMVGDEERLFNCIMETLCRVAIKSQNLDVLKYCYEVIGEKKISLDAREEVMYAYRKEFDDSTIVASQFENSDILNYLLENGLKLNKICFETAIKNNSIKCMKYILELPSEIKKSCFENKDNFYNMAFESNSYEALIFLHDNNFPLIKNVLLTQLNSKLFWKFVLENNIQINMSDKLYLNRSLWFANKFNLKMMKENNLFWNEKLSSMITKNGQLNLLKYLHENNCPWDVNTTICACEKMLCNNDPDFYEIPNKLGCLKYAIENNCPFDICTAWSAAHNLEMIKYLYNNNLKMDSSVYENAIQEDNFDVVKFLFSIGIELDEKLFEYVFKNSQFNEEIFNFLVENTSPMNSKLYNYIIHRCYDHEQKLRCIKKLININCPTSLLNLKEVAKKYSIIPPFRLELFKLIHNKNIQLDEELFKESYKRLDDIFKYLLEIKAPFYQKYLKLFNNIQKVNNRETLIVDPNDTEYEFSSNEEYPDDY